MSFRDNLQHLRSTHGMTQEQLAMLVGVSRQSVTKWEAEKAYPEMDKLLKICAIFSCTLDELVSGDLTSRSEEPGQSVPAGASPTDVVGYDEFMRSFAWRIALGVGLIILGFAMSMLFEEAHLQGMFASSDALSAASVFVFAAAGLAFIIPAGINRGAFVRAHPYVENFYTSEDHAQTSRIFSIGLVAGIAIILLGMALSSIFWEGTPYEGLFLVCAALGVPLIVYASLMRGRINVSGYNNASLENLSDEEVSALGLANTAEKVEQRRRAKRLGAIYGIIMLVATATALVLLFVSFASGGWDNPSNHFFWLPWPIGGICCGIVTLMYQVRS